MKAFNQDGRLLDKMLAGLEWQRQQAAWMKDGGQFVPHPATWLNQGRWDDEPFHAPTLTERSTQTMLALQRAFSGTSGGGVQ
jgi:hypothetical protein